MIIPSATFLVTRSTLERRFLLRPGPVTNQVITYCLFRAAQRYDILVHAYSAQANHFHAVVTDTRGQLSDFMHWLDRHIALCLMKHYERTHPHRQLEGIWSKQPFSATLLMTPEAIVDKIVYVLTNPVKDGQVPDYRQWPGVTSRPSHWHRPVRTARRPKLYFNQKSEEHREVDRHVSIPLQFADRRPADFVQDIEEKILAKQRACAATMAAEGRPFRGARAVLTQRPFDAPHGRRAKHGMNPRLAATGNPQALRQGIAALRSFRERYREAWNKFRSGIAAVFPAGTYLMRRLFNCPCEPVDVPWCCLACGPG